jgi:hypothetical protein
MESGTNLWIRHYQKEKEKKKGGRSRAAVNLSLLNERNETMKNYKIAIKRVDMARKNYSFGSVIDDDGKIECRCDGCVKMLFAVDVPLLNVNRKKYF